MSKTVEKKILPAYFEEILSGKKTFELRLGDFEGNEGDTLVLREWDADKKQYTGREIAKKISHVRRFKIDELHWPVEEVLEKGLAIISFGDITTQ